MTAGRAVNRSKKTCLISAVGVINPATDSAVMMRSKEKAFDDIAKVAGGAMNVMSGLTRQIRDEMRARFDEIAANLNLVPREDFERLESMLSEARRQQALMEKRLSALESGAPRAKAKTRIKKKTKRK